MSDQDEKAAPERRKAFGGAFDLPVETVVIDRGVAMDATGLQDGEEGLEAEALALMETFDSRLTANEKQIDRVLARLGVE